MRWCWLFCCWWLCADCFAAVQKVVYAWPKAMAADERGHYPIALLQLALAKSGQSYEAIPSELLMSQYRTLRQLELAQGVDLVWTMTSPERERQLRPIRIPIDRGLIGWRLLLIRAGDQTRFSALPPWQLKELSTVQGLDWPDYAILKSNHFKVFNSNSFAGMFDMLQSKRVDYFPRSVTEIWPELHSRPQLNLQVAPQLVLYYPAALYFFVQKDNKALADSIEKGLRLAMQDGSMKQLFLQHFSEVLQKADLANRIIVPLTNPLLPAETPLQDRALWFDPQQGY